jgi:hypothetical protein
VKIIFDISFRARGRQAHELFPFDQKVNKAATNAIKNLITKGEAKC